VVALQEATSYSLELLQESAFVRRSYAMSALSLTQGYDVLLLVRASLGGVFQHRRLPSQMMRRVVFWTGLDVIVATAHLESLRSPEVRCLSVPTHRTCTVIQRQEVHRIQLEHALTPYAVITVATPQRTS
jgi:hypothetical protein